MALTVDAKKAGNYTPPACSNGNPKVLEKNKHCVTKIHLTVAGTDDVTTFQLVKVPNEEVIGSANLQGGDSHDFMVNSGSYEIRLIGGTGAAKEIDSTSGDCTKISGTSAGVSIGSGQTKTCNLLLGVGGAGGGIGGNN